MVVACFAGVGMSVPALWDQHVLKGTVFFLENNGYERELYGCSELGSHPASAASCEVYP